MDQKALRQLGHGALTACAACCAALAIGDWLFVAIFAGAAFVAMRAPTLCDQASYGVTRALNFAFASSSESASQLPAPYTHHRQDSCMQSVRRYMRPISFPCSSSGRKSGNGDVIFICSIIAACVRAV